MRVGGGEQPLALDARRCGTARASASARTGRRTSRRAQRHSHEHWRVLSRQLCPLEEARSCDSCQVKVYHSAVASVRPRGASSKYTLGHLCRTVHGWAPVSALANGEAARSRATSVTVASVGRASKDRNLKAAGPGQPGPAPDALRCQSRLGRQSRAPGPVFTARPVLGAQWPRSQPPTLV